MAPKPAQSEPRTAEQEAALEVLAQLLATVIKRDVDAKLAASRRVVKSV